MAIVYVRELAKGRSGSGEVQDRHREYTRVFRVRTDALTDNQVLVLASPLLPQPGQPFPVDAGALAVKSNAVQEDDDPFRWIVTVTYSTQSADPEEEKENPLDRPPDVSWDNAQFTRPATKDIDGKAILNSAGDPFDPPYEIDDSRPVLKIVRNEASFSPQTAYYYRDALNDSEFYGAPAGTAKMKAPTAQKQYENGMSFWRVSYEIHFNPDGWDASLLDAGFNELYYENNVYGKRLIKDSEGEPVSQPVPLDGQGAALANPTVDNAVFLDFKVYRRRNYAALNLE